MRTKNRLSVFIFITCAIGFAFIVAEGVSRAKFFQNVLEQNKGKIETPFSGTLIGNDYYRLPTDQAYERFPVNSMGGFGDDFNEPKKKGEFRILILGGTYANGLHSSLKTSLNSSADWPPTQARKTTHVMNYSLPGLSAVQFGYVARDARKSMDVDLVLVIYNQETLVYKPFLLALAASMRDQEQFASIPSEARTSQFESILFQQVLRSRRLHILVQDGQEEADLSEHFGSQALAKFVHTLAPSSNATVYPNDPLIRDVNEAAQRNFESFSMVLRSFSNVMLIRIPTRIEFPSIVGTLPADYRSDMRELHEATARILSDQFSDVTFHRLLKYLPSFTDPKNAELLFQPHEPPLTLLGDEVYGAAIARLLIKNADHVDQ